MSFLLLSLPEDLSVQLFSFWFVPEHAAKLDSAFCNRIGRDLFLNLIQNKLLVLNNIHIELKSLNGFYSWIGLRSIQIEKLVFQNDIMNPQLNTSKVNTVVFANECSKYFVTNILNKTKCLTELSFICLEKIDKTLLQSIDLRIFHTLQRLSLENVVFLSTYNIYYFSTVCTNLVALTLSHWSNLQESDLIMLIQKNPNMKEIHLDLIDTITNEFLYCAGRLSLLTDCFVSDGKNISLCAVQFLLEACPQITFLNLMTSKGDSFMYVVESDMDRSLMIEGFTSFESSLCAIFELLPSLHMVSLKRNELISDVLIRHIANENLHLSAFSIVSGGVNYGRDSIIYLLRKCSMLTFLQLADCEHLDQRDLQLLFKTPNRLTSICLIHASLQSDTVINILNVNQYIREFCHDSHHHNLPTVEAELILRHIYDLDNNQVHIVKYDEILSPFSFWRCGMVHS